MNLFIKHMVSNRCKLVVEQEFQKSGIPIKHIELGRVVIAGSMTPIQRHTLEKNLKALGLVLMEDKKRALVEKIKMWIERMVLDPDLLNGKRFSACLSEKLCHNYTYLSTTFSEVMEMTLESYLIQKKIERVKLLLLNENLNLTQISYQLQYSSVAHLSNQFKKVTGLSPTRFKKLNSDRVWNQGSGASVSGF